MNKSASPTPWKVMLNYDNMINEEREGRHTIKDADDWNIARVWEMSNSQANAELIVKAVNSYAPLLEALKLAAEALAEWHDETTLPFIMEAIDKAVTK